MYNDKEIINILKKRLRNDRFNHSLQVAKLAEQLASKHGLAVYDARLAGLLHDYAKNLEEKQLYEIIDKVSWEIDQQELALSQTLHAPVAAYLVEKDLGIKKPEILAAIRYHTIGCPHMGKLAQIIFIADYIEPNRDFPGLKLIKSQVNKGIKTGIIAICNHIIKYNIELNRQIHPNTLLLRNMFLRGKD